MDDGVRDGVPLARAQADAFERYVVPEIEVLLRVARSLTRDLAEAEDLVQETLLRAHRSLASFDGRHPRAWLLTILRNAHLNRLRRPRPELVRDPSAAASEPIAPDLTDGFVERELDAELERALADLPASFRRVVELVDMDGHAYVTAAELLGVPVGTVMSRLHRARRRIRTHLLRAGVDPRGRG